ncbi:acetolactate synthase large subunit [Bosea sp. BK604]|uniref:acetolactate synthase large subunit n=1 Tax=Bosea sp. BK604 TaxID=2512180 RepID=UPI00104CE7A1|nr:acetolactate synthase large subunit [Bosea sp. BK604]TCR61792.1 acetolactate synthase-1/2/3 large subunit [Bosea sp. BK604]
MNGAESIVQTLLDADVTTCFGNPGTSEMHFVAALDRIAGMRCVLGLFEGVVTGAADGYGRMADKPAATLLHCGPGLANGLANLHNARRARTPVVNIVGDQATYHRELDPPLTADTEGWARGVSAWTRTAASAATVGLDTATAVQAARSSPGRIATLIAPADTCWDEGGVVAKPLPVPPPPTIAPHRIAEIARLLRGGEPVLLLLGGTALRSAALEDAYRIAEATGARLMAQQFNGRVERGQGRLPIRRLSYGVAPSLAELAEFRHIVLIGATPPVAPFAYPGKPGHLAAPGTSIHVFARPEENMPDALARLADELSAPKLAVPRAPQGAGPGRGNVTQEAVTQTLAALLPDNAVVVDESVSFGRLFFNGLAGAAPHDWLQITGGAIGSGLPMATGAALGAPGRRVVSLQADGSAMYTVQALWTQAREQLPITTVILSNRKYAILLGELDNVGANAGKVALDMLTLDNPAIGWVGIASNLGVEAARAEDMETFADLFTAANRRPGPFVIELTI